LLILTFKWVTKETNGEIHRRRKHTIPIKMANIVSTGKDYNPNDTYWDSVRNTGMVFVAVKFSSKKPYLMRMVTPRSTK
jgi:hypothetical protein